jgi:hypothetical protein
MGGSGVLYVRDMATPFMPRAGDSVGLWLDSEGEDGPSWQVKRHYWRSDGRVEIELVPIQIDPDDKIVAGIRSQPGQLPYRLAWWTDADGDPEPRLLAGGWRLYSSDAGEDQTPSD